MSNSSESRQCITWHLTLFFWAILKFDSKVFFYIFIVNVDYSWISKFRIFED